MRSSISFTVLACFAACNSGGASDPTRPPDGGIAIDATDPDAAAIDAARTDADPPLPVDAAVDASAIDAPIAQATPATRLGEGGDPDVAINAAGDVAVSWCAGDQVMARRHVGAAWTPAVRLDTGARCWQTELAVTPSGDVHVAWLDEEDGVWTARYGGGSWSAPEQLDTAEAAFSVGRLTLEADAAGNAMALWVQNLAGADARIAARRYTPETGWQALAVVQPAVAGGSYGDLQVGFDASGGAVALWKRAIEGADTLWASRFGAGAWSAPQQLPGVISNPVNPVMVVLPDGRAFAVWKSIVSATGPTVNQYSRFAPASGWTAAQSMGTDNSGEPTIATDASHDVVVAWNSEDANRLRRFTAGGAEDALLGPGGFAPRLARAHSDQFTMAWREGTPFPQLWIRRFTWGDWNTAERADVIDGEIYDWELVGNAGGRAAAAWVQIEGPLQPEGNVFEIWAVVL